MKTYTKGNALKIFVILIIVLGYISFTSAQTLNVGAKGGFTASTLYGDDAKDIEMRPGYTLGGFFGVGPGDGVFMFQPELLYQTKGATKYNSTINTRQELKANYLNVPLLFKFRIPISNTFYPNFFIGPQFAYTVSNKYTVNNEDINAGVSREIEVRKGDVGGILGAGLDIQSNRIIFSIDARTGIGFLSIDNPNDNREPYDWKHLDFTVLAGIGVLIGK